MNNEYKTRNKKKIPGTSVIFFRDKYDFKFAEEKNTLLGKFQIQL